MKGGDELAELPLALVVESASSVELLKRFMQVKRK